MHEPWKASAPEVYLLTTTDGSVPRGLDPNNMEVAFVKHDPRNISAFGEDRIGANRPELQCQMHLENFAFYTAL